MRASAFVLSCSALVVALGSAQPSLASESSLIGFGLGAAFGGLLGSEIGHGSGRVAATGLGIVAGGLIGSAIGEEIERDAYYPEHQYKSFTPSPVYYYPPVVYYSYQPNYVAPPDPPVQAETYIDQGGAYCRTYSEEIIVDGIPRESFGKACLQPDGTWRTVQ